MEHEKLIKDCGAFISKCPNESSHTIDCEICRMQYAEKEIAKEILTEIKNLCIKKGTLYLLDWVDLWKKYVGEDKQ
ncbi:MAG: hypothetical protein IJX81_01115 [Clostridia bacterium]|nr:hypothetical protein [Clostridia bacterium]